MEKIILKSFLSPGDILTLTAAVRDLHKNYPNRFLTDTRTSCAALWENNPYITRIEEDDPEARIINAEYPLIHKSSKRCDHFINGYLDNLNHSLAIRSELTEFKGDIHLSADERERPGPIEQLTGARLPYWIVVGGGKFDFTIKWWDTKRYQQVVDRFKDRILFVQVGEENHYHPKLDNVIDYRKKTTLRDVIRLMYYADGVLCPVTFLMHLAAATPLPKDGPRQRGCVVVAGGREPPHWEAYPSHQFIHNVGALPCCARSGCWKSRTTALGDGAASDDPSRLCVDVVDGLPRCMDMITADDVSRRIETYYNGRMLRFLTSEESDIARPFLTKDPFRALLDSYSN